MPESVRTKPLAAVAYGGADWGTVAGPVDFETLFGHSPRPLQTAVREAPLDAPLLILESETGSGKTEAAVLRFATLLKAGLVDGLYFAVPTRAAAKQLHGRVHRAVSALLPDPWANETALAVPGYLLMGAATGERRGQFDVHWKDDLGVYWEDKRDEVDRVAHWSAESTRHYFSAPAAVGTVDQALLAALKVKWAHLRGASLARSLLVVDEVHASDAYMAEILSALLDAHLAVGGHALLMSATLGATARLKFTSETARVEPPDPQVAQREPYPSLTLAGNGAVVTQAVKSTGASKCVSMEIRAWLGDARCIAAMAKTAAEEGASVLVIRNTVPTAQAVLEELLDLQGGELALQVDGIPTLHHSRFAVEDRRRLDDAVEAALGKGREPRGRVVIGTQTLEQSLDIDADLLVTDICPVDVLLQRIGRLHRHRRERPSKHAAPRCVVLVPSDGLGTGLDGSLMRHGLGFRPGSPGGGIYSNLPGLEQTLRLTQDHADWWIPAMNRMLVERGTNPKVLSEVAQQLGAAWVEHASQDWGGDAATEQSARRVSLDRSVRFDPRELVFPEIDEHVRTRLGEDGPRFELASGGNGPFGTPVRTFNLPAHLFGGLESRPSAEELEAAQFHPQPGGGTLHVGKHVFRYDQTGIRPMAI